MVKRVGGSRTSRRTAWSFGRAADLAALAVIAVASLGLAAAALIGVHLHPSPVGAIRTAPASSEPSAEPTPSSTPTPTPTPVIPVAVSLLHDGAVSTGGSWWSLSVGAGAVPNAVDGAEVPAPTAATTQLTVEELGSLLEGSPSLQGYIVVQAGSTEVADGAEPAPVARSLGVLWQAIRDRGGIPIATLLPPSDDDASETNALNSAIASAAQAAGVGVLDLHTAVSTPSGFWAAGLSDDGETANADGSSALATAAEAQLPVLLTAR
ncbi:GDSL-type esterase/lipase family protein [Agreia pratensis]|uniref:GDSL-like Lipase/Acylhydrolase family protein n=1 Tax=Agreia pratensis TaxID=150121 RepID=A0A1X7IN46_9MICO|nr:GDSL-type esterase/lipase family protein [Agreia pratensis]SMG16119.1 GDSL-like Lipase/Acylhydrolase family protein [Agreia pratensis]